jgi:Zn-dependent M28 family amino/carboxypeptidase
VLELARLFRDHVPREPVQLVAFSTEEPPFFGSEQMGSAVHAAALARQRRNVRGMISLEMIGYFSSRRAWPSWVLRLLYPDHGDIVAVSGRWSDRSLTDTAETLDYEKMARLIDGIQLAARTHSSAR